MVEIGLVVLEIQKTGFGNFAVPVNNTLVCRTSFFVLFATGTLLCVLIPYRYTRKQYLLRALDHLATLLLISKICNTLMNLMQFCKLTDILNILETSLIVNYTLTLDKKVLLLSAIITTLEATIMPWF